MKDEEINFEIAVACGWQNVHKPGFPGLVLGVPPKSWRLNRDPFPNYYGRHYEVPNFVADLNAMRQAEETLLPDDAMYSQRNFYASILGDITMNDNGRGWTPLTNDDCFQILHATARQRAEAFLRVLEKWKDA